MRDMYDISVIVPVYNTEKYIRQCIDSILKQTKSRIEIILVNDGSTDGSLSILQDYADKNGDIKLISQENGGLAAARITGLNAARGKYIGWVDADDFIEADMYQILFDTAEKDNADYVYCDYDFYPGKVKTKEKWFKPYQGRIDWEYIDRNTQCWNTLTQKRLIDDIELTKLYPRFQEYSWIAVMLHAKKTISIDMPLYHYRVGEETMSGGSYRGKLDHFWDGANISKHLFDITIGTGYEEKLKLYFEYRYIYTLLQVEIVAAVNNKSKDYYIASQRLADLDFRSNPLTKKILDNNHGKAKSFIIRNIISRCYYLARVVVCLAL